MSSNVHLEFPSLRSPLCCELGEATKDLSNAISLSSLVSCRSQARLMSETYSKRALLLVDLLNKYAPLSTIEIPKPSGGMFLWVRLRVESHPSFPVKTPQEISQQVFDSMIEEKVLAAPGHFFKAPSVTPTTAEDDAKKMFIRMSYALPPPEDMEEGVKRFSRALRKEWQVSS